METDLSSDSQVVSALISFEEVSSSSEVEERGL